MASTFELDRVPHSEYLKQTYSSTSSLTFVVSVLDQNKLIANLQLLDIFLVKDIFIFR